MASQYSVIQYVPNPIADERINIGVLAFNDQVVRVHFLQNWKRVKQFGNEDVSFLREFADRMEESAARGSFFLEDVSKDIPKHQQIIKVARGWMNSIQFTEPCGSLLDVDSLLEDAAETYLIEIENIEDNLPKKIFPRDRKVASKIANKTVKQVLKELKGEQAQEYFKTSLAGKHEGHKLDAVVANGKPYLAVHGLSFEVHSPKSVLDALSWAIVDVKNSYQGLPFGVLLLPPKRELRELTKAYETAIEKYEDLGAIVLKENDLEDWTNQTLAQLNL
ncbi:DUF3037 domain-containing protein [Pseudanabaena sp. FACHB-1277]|uniref:DUF3037 domain-containing protein n=1 Tax=Pseudanabaena cinerea FACHB-1277 TaxID=2949581 RepID=A0A926UUR7_9CYAN|nr:DUF3037 domain-containing protein [Pseudanabaena cinerea]MBD2150430.1 DUF3037 domain-containing protein [Pseudanabaena cinerea FACHB-1277]